MSRMLLDERILRDGRRASTWAQVVDGMLQLVDDDGTSGQLSPMALERVMVRYGRPLDPAILLENPGDPWKSLTRDSAGVRPSAGISKGHSTPDQGVRSWIDGAALEVGEGGRLRRLRYHAIVDAEGRDYLVWERPNHAPLAVIASHATAALRYLVMRIGDERTPRQD